MPEAGERSRSRQVCPQTAQPRSFAANPRGLTTHVARVLGRHGAQAPRWPPEQTAQFLALRLRIGGPVPSLYLTAALLPAVPAFASVMAAIDLRDWTGLDAALVRATTPDALLYSAACVVVAAPLAGVGVTSRRRLAVAGAIFCAVSAGLTLARLGVSGDAVRFVATSHAVLASAVLALAALGALLASILRHPLDAVALALGVALTASYGLLVAGAPVGGLSTTWLEAAMLASPVMTMATAAQVDLVRTDIWYQVSPLAHVRLEYPALSTVCGAYLLAGGAAFTAAAIRTNGARVRAGG